MSEYLIQYEQILQNYRYGLYGNEQLSIEEILRRADAEHILAKLTKNDLEYFFDNADESAKLLYAHLFQTAK